MTAVAALTDIWLTGHRAAVIDKVQHFTPTFSISHHLMSASVNLPLHHKVYKFSSGTGSPRWSWKKGR